VKKAEVYILGQKYTIKGDASEKHIEMLAGYVDEQIKEVLDKAPNIAPLNAAILAAMNMAEEIHKLKAEQEDISKYIEEETEKLARLLD
jgi:cell division protein ZapA